MPPPSIAKSIISCVNSSVSIVIFSLVPIYMFVDCCYCKRASWKIGLESNELPSLNKEFT